MAGILQDLGFALAAGVTGLTYTVAQRRFSHWTATTLLLALGFVGVGLALRLSLSRWLLLVGALGVVAGASSLAARLRARSSEPRRQ